MTPKKKTVALGLVFVLLLFFAYTENNSFFASVGDVFANPLVAIFFVFVHNVLVVSLILLGMTFYVDLVMNFMANREEEHVIINNPRIFAFIFTLIIIFISILRASTLVYGQVFLNTLIFAIILSTPNAILEGYGLFQTIKRTLNRKVTTKALAAIYLLFFVAAVIEVGYVYLLRAVI
ncbi:MAG: hypothetical protein QCH99_00645 [Candidatus Bathyarchaeota archaeon]|nr:hypothetical protein [Candidatus Bathyarchaeum tardum]WGM89433.1 MAG: hypothetical protein NUK63_11110 [Candidatus Bathyarchaeum tardum]